MNSLQDINLQVRDDGLQLALPIEDQTVTNRKSAYLSPSSKLENSIKNVNMYTKNNVGLSRGRIRENIQSDSDDLSSSS